MHMVASPAPPSHQLLAGSITSPNPFQKTLLTLNSANCNVGNEVARNRRRFRASSKPALHSSRSVSQVAVACKRSQRLHMVAQAAVHPVFVVSYAWKEVSTIGSR
jgi:hypothetical protein